MDSDLIVGGVKARRGARQVVRLPVTTDLNGAPVEVVTHIASGARPGPVFTLLSMLHGNEWLSVLIIRRLLESLDLKQVAGTILAVPVANPVAFLTGTRSIQDDSDSPDLNRAFGGPFLWLCDQIAGVIERELLRKTDLMLDFHISDWGSTMASVLYGDDYKDPEMTRKCRDLAKNLGYPCLHVSDVCHGFPGPRSSLGFAGQMIGVPCAAVEIGGLGFGQEQEEAWVQENVRCIRNAMMYAGMLEGTPELPGRYLVMHSRWRVAPSRAGYLEPLVGLDRQFTEVKKGEALARLIDPYTLEEVEVLRSPGRGVIFYACRPYMIRPGQWAFGVGNLDDGKTGWYARDAI